MSKYRWERDANAGMPTIRWHRLRKHFRPIKKPRGWRRKRAAQIRVYMDELRAQFIRVDGDAKAFFMRVQVDNPRIGGLIVADTEPKP